jgi:hypothetical protein
MKVSEIKMSDDPYQISECLVEEYGLDHALPKALEEAVAAQEKGENYNLSVWREVKQILRERKAADGPSN